MNNLCLNIHKTIQQKLKLKGIAVRCHVCLQVLFGLCSFVFVLLETREKDFTTQGSKYNLTKQDCFQSLAEGLTYYVEDFSLKGKHSNLQDKSEAN